MNIIALGKTGQGKSSTLNTILGQEKFAIGNSMQAVTNRAESAIRTEGRFVRCVDTVGLFDAKTSLKDTVKQLDYCAQLCSDGVHAILIVVRGNDRLTKDGVAALNILKEKYITHKVRIMNHIK